MIEKNPKSIFSDVTEIKATFRKKNIGNKNSNRKKGMDKEGFVKFISLLDESEALSGILIDSGIDLTNYESKYYEMVEILLESIFNQHQILYLQAYLYGKENFRNVPKVVDENGSIMEPENPEELWVAINKIQ